MKKAITDLVRPNILRLKPYSCARDEFKGEASAYLDANENPLNTPWNRYPDPLQLELKDRVAKMKNVSAEQLFFGNGSDEPIDLIIRIFCEPGRDNVVAIDPTYGMYQVCADINGVEYRKVLLNEDYTLDAKRLLDAADANSRVVFLCSPNNPTGNTLFLKDIEMVLEQFDGIVVVDEAYIDFASSGTFVERLEEFPNLIVLQTFSKAWGLAAVRLGMAFASPEIISFFNKVKYPYNINLLTQQFVLGEINKLKQKEEWVTLLLNERETLRNTLNQLPLVNHIYPSDANFLLVKVNNANAVYNFLVHSGIIVRNRNSVSLCEGCLRITIGTHEENNLLINALKKYHE